MVQHLMTVIPELNNASIRRTTDGRCSVYDMISVLGQQEKPHEVWEKLYKTHSEVLAFCENFRFPGKRQKETPVTDREGWAYIIGLLPGVIGRKYREASADLVIRYLDADGTLAERSEDEECLEWPSVRIKGKRIRNEHTRMLYARGVCSNLDFAICTNRTYQGLYGATASGLRKRKKLPPKSNVRDHMTTTELIEVGFSESLSTRKIKQTTAHGLKECGNINYKTAQSVADFIRDTLAS